MNYPSVQIKLIQISKLTNHKSPISPCCPVAWASRKFSILITTRCNCKDHLVIDVLSEELNHTFMPQQKQTFKSTSSSHMAILLILERVESNDNTDLDFQKKIPHFQLYFHIKTVTGSRWLETDSLCRLFHQKCAVEFFDALLGFQDFLCRQVY